MIFMGLLYHKSVNDQIKLLLFEVAILGNVVIGLFIYYFAFDGFVSRKTFVVRFLLSSDFASSEAD